MTPPEKSPLLTGSSRWPMVVLTGLACGAFCGLFPVLVLHLLRQFIPGLGG